MKKRIKPQWLTVVLFAVPLLTAGCELFLMPVGGDGCDGHGTCKVKQQRVGVCRDGCTRAHMGYDIGGRRGDPIVAVSDGKVTKVKSTWSGTGAGKYLVIDHKNGYFSRYMHMDSFTVGLDQEVNQGQVIGTMGNTGTTPVHLHFELWDAQSGRHDPKRLRTESWPGEKYLMSGPTHSKSFRTFYGGYVNVRAINLNDAISENQQFSVGGKFVWDSKTPRVEKSPTGWIDSISSSGSASGWACDRDASGVISVHMYAGGQAGSGTWVGAVSANRSSEAAINNQCGGGNKHRFVYNIPSQHKGKMIYFYGIDKNPSSGGGNRVLKGAPKRYP